MSVSNNRKENLSHIYPLPKTWSLKLRNLIRLLSPERVKGLKFREGSRYSSN